MQKEKWKNLKTRRRGGNMLGTRTGLKTGRDNNTNRIGENVEDTGGW